MAAYAEGLNVLHKADVGNEERQTTPRRRRCSDPEYYQYDIDTAEVAEVWRRGSVIASWLLDLTAAALRSRRTSRASGARVRLRRGALDGPRPVEEGVPAPVLSASLYQRFSSRGHDDFANEVLLGDAQQFGGHDETVSA